MLILILGITIAALVTFLVLRAKCPRDDDETWATHIFYTSMSWVFGFVVLGFIIAICCLAPIVATEDTIDSKIEMFQEENTNIERDIDQIVKEYLRHEHDTFADLKADGNSITLVTLFPELKSDTLVQKQLDIYINNNSQIKSLKEQKIDITKIKWILYFGK